MFPRRAVPVAALLGVLVGAGPGAVGALPASPAAAAECAEPGAVIRPRTWAQQTLDPESVWPFTDGRGVTVAVLASGVDGAQPQLSGRVDRGADFLTGTGTGPGNTDCRGLGTQVAGVIAARPSDAVGFAGLAPGVRVLPVAVSEGLEVGGSGRTVDLPAFARAIDFAAERAQVVAVPVVTYSDNPRVRAAVARALARGVTVVAAVATRNDTPGRPYPAAYDGVIGVGAVRQDGSLAPGSPASPFVDLVAPGADLFSTQRVRGYVPVQGTSIATGYVAAAAALVHARLRGIPPAEVTRRLVATATPAPGGPGSVEYGNGIVNPYAAVTDTMASGAPVPVPALRRPTPDAAAAARASAWSGKQRVAAWLAAAGAVAAIVVLVLAAALPRGRRRQWRPGMAAPVRDDPERDRPSPPVQLFDDA